MFALRQVVYFFQQCHIVFHEPCLPLFILHHVFLHLLFNVLDVLLQEVSLLVDILACIPFVYYLFQNVLLVQMYQLFFQFFVMLNLFYYVPHVTLKFLLEILL